MLNSKELAPSTICHYVLVVLSPKHESDGLGDTDQSQTLNQPAAPMSLLSYVTDDSDVIGGDLCTDCANVRVPDSLT